MPARIRLGHDIAYDICKTEPKITLYIPVMLAMNKHPETERAGDTVYAMCQNSRQLTRTDLEEQCNESN